MTYKVTFLLLLLDFVGDFVAAHQFENDSKSFPNIRFLAKFVHNFHVKFVCSEAEQSSPSKLLRNFEVVILTFLSMRVVA